MTADKSINLDTLYKVLFENEKPRTFPKNVSERWRKVSIFCNPFPAIRLFMVSIRGSVRWLNTESKTSH